MCVVQSAKSVSPGLAENTWSICERVFDQQMPVAAGMQYSSSAARGHKARAQHASPLACSISAAQARSALVSGVAPRGGEEDDDANDRAATDAFDLDGLDTVLGGALHADDETLRAYVRRHFGNNAFEVLDVLRLWKAYLKMHLAWRNEWTADDESYRAKRALRILRAGATASFLDPL
eukprot:6205965-Pleurochrysis_carterae.AAC.5